jgi:hypothetical protein
MAKKDANGFEEDAGRVTLLSDIFRTSERMRRAGEPLLDWLREHLDILPEYVTERAAMLITVLLEAHEQFDDVMGRFWLEAPEGG